MTPFAALLGKMAIGSCPFESLGTKRVLAKAFEDVQDNPDTEAFMGWTPPASEPMPVRRGIGKTTKENKPLVAAKEALPPRFACVEVLRNPLNGLAPLGSNTRSPKRPREGKDVRTLYSLQVKGIE